MPDPAVLDTLPSVSPRGRTIVHVCTSCRRAGQAAAEDTAADEPRPGARLQAGLAALAAPELAVLPVACLGNCSRGCTVALQAPDSIHGPSWTYVFGDLDPGAATEVREAARLLAAAPDGLMPWRGRPEAFKRGLIARIPPLPSYPAFKDAAE